MSEREQTTPDLSRAEAFPNLQFSDPLALRLDIADIRTFVFRAPIMTPVQTSFGAMFDRPMTLVRIEDRDGAVGWGEIWCNYPSCGAEHRAHLISTTLRPILIGRTFPSPRAATENLTQQTRILAIQSAEPGPFAQCIAGIDIALWDLAARRMSIPLWQLLGGMEPTIQVYASGLNPDQPEKLAAAKHAEGFRAFKLKVGFGTDRDTANLRALRSTLGDAVQLMADANQAWDLEHATVMAARMKMFGLEWLEEPLAADAPWTEWNELRRKTSIPLAAGENIAGDSGFAAAIGAGSISVLQPDVAKWGGLSGCFTVAKRAIAAGLRYCPHYLGGGVGLLASAHLLAAIGGGGLLEIDANDNLLRTALMGPLREPKEGACTLSGAPGLGISSEISDLNEFLTLES